MVTVLWGCSSKWGRVWGVSLASDTGCGRDARVPRGMSPNLDHTRGLGRLPDFLHGCSWNAGGLLTLGAEEVCRASFDSFL